MPVEARRLAPVVSERLTRTVLDPPAVQLAESLYGVTWSESLRERNGDYAPRRVPFPVDIARFLLPILTGVLYHDRRAQQDTRSLGWWVLTTDGWVLVDPEGLAWLLSDCLDDCQRSAEQQLRAAQALLQAAAVAEQHAYEGARHREAQLPGREAAMLRFHGDPAAVEASAARDAADRAVSYERLRIVIVSSLQAAIKRVRNPWPQTLRTLRSALPPMPEEVGLEIARVWLLTALPYIPVDASNRIRVSDVHDVWTDWPDGTLPLRQLFRFLDKLLHGRIRDRYWVLDRDRLLAAPEDAARFAVESVFASAE